MMMLCGDIFSHYPWLTYFQYFSLWLTYFHIFGSMAQSFHIMCHMAHIFSYLMLSTESKLSAKIILIDSVTGGFFSFVIITIKGTFLFFIIS